MIRALRLMAGAAAAVGLSLTACAPTQWASAEGTHRVESRVVDVSGPHMLLSNGLQVEIPASVAPWSQISIGSVVVLRYEEKDGRNVATSMEFREGQLQRGL